MSGYVRGAGMQMPKEMPMFPIGFGAFLVWVSGYGRTEPMSGWGSMLVLLTVVLLAWYISELRSRLQIAEQTLSNVGYAKDDTGDWVPSDDTSPERIP